MAMLTTAAATHPMGGHAYRVTSEDADVCERCRK